MKYSLLLLSALCFTTLFSQNEPIEAVRLTESELAKELTLEDAVLGYYKGLYPERLQGFQWVKGKDSYIFLNKDKWELRNGADNELEMTLDLDFFKKDFVQFDRVPAIQEIHENELVFTKNGAVVIYSFRGENKGNKTVIITPKEATNRSFNYKAQAVAYTIDNNLYLATTRKSKIAIVENEDKNIVTGQAIHRYEFGISKGIFWSPEGNSIAFYQKDETDVADYPLLNINSTPGELNSIKYPMAGQKSEYVKVGIYNLKKGSSSFLGLVKRKMKLKTGGEQDDHYLTNITWSPNEEKIYIAEVNREQNHMRFNEYDVASKKKVRTIFEEKHEKWIEPENPGFFPTKDENTMLWLSEKDGFMNLYKVELTTGKWNQLTQFQFPITSFMGTNEAGNLAFVQATGDDGREKHIYKVNIETGKSTQLTEIAGTHTGAISSTGKYVMDAYSSITIPRKTQLINTVSSEKMEIHNAENPVKTYRMATMEFGELTSKGGEKLYSRMFKPADFDASKKYPVLIYVYGGPHAQMITNSWGGGASMWMHWMANQGYIVFTVDGRGSANRGLAFENQIHRQIGEVEIQDQLTGVEFLKSLSFVDAKRLAVHGWSYGGFMTTSLMLRHPGVFTTAVAGGPVIDWKWYEIMYGERYMDSPQENPEGYKKNSLLQYVKNLDGKLLLIHGTVDDVVVMQHNLALVQQSVTDGIQLDFFPYPMHPHNVRGRDRVHLMTKVLNYVMEHNK
ncbi:MAG: DPP IV N-terminal domain-containing protein [Flavobacteriales bacterium]